MSASRFCFKSNQEQKPRWHLQANFTKFTAARIVWQ